MQRIESEGGFSSGTRARRGGWRGRLGVALALGLAVWGVPIAGGQEGERALSFDLLGSHVEASGEVDSFAEEESARGALLDNARLTLDLSARGIVDTGEGDTSSLGAIGIDYHKIISGRSVDLATARVQIYLNRGDDLERRGEYLDDDDDWGIEYRFVDLTYTGLGRGKPYLRVGHFEVPFGLESFIDTNGTVRQTLISEVVGLKDDWGAAIGGELSEFNYEAALTRGTGQEIEFDSDLFAVSGRVGTPTTRARGIGLSGFWGRVEDARAGARRAALGSSDGVEFDRTRVALDARLEHGRWGLLGEAGGGFDDGDPAWYAFVEGNLRDPRETTLAYAQLRVRGLGVGDEWDEGVDLVGGVRYRPDSHWTLSAEYVQTLDPFRRGDIGGQLVVQLRYRF